MLEALSQRPERVTLGGRGGGVPSKQSGRGGVDDRVVALDKKAARRREALAT